MTEPEFRSVEEVINDFKTELHKYLRPQFCAILEMSYGPSAATFEIDHNILVAIQEQPAGAAHPYRVAGSLGEEHIAEVYCYGLQLVQVIAVVVELVVMIARQSPVIKDYADK